MIDRDLARMATIISYRNRVTESAHLADGSRLLPPGKPKYKGNFHYQNVADAAPLPNGADVRDHRVTWRELYRLFDEEWRMFEREQRV